MNTRSTKRSAVTIALGVALAASLAGCGKTDPTPGATSAAGATGATSAAATTAAPSTALDACKQLEAKGLTTSCRASKKLSVVGARAGVTEEVDFDSGSLLRGDTWSLAGNGTVSTFPTDQTYDAIFAKGAVREGASVSVYRFGNRPRRFTIDFAVMGTIPEAKRKEIQAAVDGL